MWKSVGRFKKIFNKLILVLLCLHLAGEQERKKRDLIYKKIKKSKGKSKAVTNDPVESIPFEQIS
jgi:hypothetical protein